MLRHYKESSNENLRCQSGAACRGDELNAQEFGLHLARYGCAGNRARFAGRSRRGVDRLILGVDVRHGALQHDVHRRRRGAEERLPAHRRAGIVGAREAGQRELCPSLRAAGKRLVVEAEADVAREERRWRRYILIGGHSNSLKKCLIFSFSFLVSEKKTENRTKARRRSNSSRS